MSFVNQNNNNKENRVFDENLLNIGSDDGFQHSANAEYFPDHCHDVNDFEHINDPKSAAINSVSSGLTDADDGNPLANHEMLKKIVEQNTNEIARLNRELKGQVREKQSIKRSNGRLNSKLLELSKKIDKESPLGVKVIE